MLPPIIGSELSLTILNKIKSEYSQLILTQRYSLLNLFSSKEIDLSSYCGHYKSHPLSEELLKSVQLFAERFHIWIPTSKHYLSCALFLFPNASKERIEIIAKLYAIDFYYNDQISREGSLQIRFSDKIMLERILHQMSTLDIDEQLGPGYSSMEKANYEILQEISRKSNLNWFHHYLDLYTGHMEVAHKDYNHHFKNNYPSLEEYINLRVQISGMPHTLSLVEFSNNSFLDWELLGKLEIKSIFLRINIVTAEIGSLMNDLFSFEKEIIDNNCFSNLIYVIAYNNPSYSLINVINKSAEVVRNLLIEFKELVSSIATTLQSISKSYPILSDSIIQYIGGLERCVQASWCWQVFTPRYKRNGSIWNETNSE